MTNDKSCFFCGTPFHIFNSIILVKNKNLYADIYIDDVFASAKTIADNLKALGVFDNVYLLDRKKHWRFPDNVLLQYLFALKGYCTFDKVVPKIIPNLKTYADFYFANDPRTDVFGRFIKFYIVKNCTKYNIHYIDDGLGSYNRKMYEITWIDKLARRLFFRKNILLFDCDYYLHSPEYYSHLNGDNKNRIYPIGMIDEDLKEVLKRVFTLNNVNTIIDYNIYFDTVRNEEFNAIGNKLVSRMIKELLSRGDFMVKSHPREMKEKYEDEYSIEFGLPFEILCLYNDFTDHILATSFSTAVFTPKLIFNQEPQIVLLYKVVKKYSKTNDALFDWYVNGYKKMYPLEKLIVCNSEEEFKKYVINNIE